MVNKGASGVLIVDRFGLPIESQGTLGQAQASLVSAMMKNAGQLSRLLETQ